MYHFDNDIWESCYFLELSSNQKSEENVNLERQERVARMTELEDLQGPRELPYASLCIKVQFIFMSYDQVCFSSG
jgi:hypothetical protein